MLGHSLIEILVLRMRMSTNWLILVMMLQAKWALTQTCLQSNGGDIPFENLGPRVAGRLPSGSQAIVTSYQFQCCGRVTRWQARMIPGGPAYRDGVYSITFQVWRPGPAVESDGCYSLVGEDVYNDVILTIPGRLADRTVDSSTVISVQPGDVVGYYVVSDNGVDMNEGIQLLKRIEVDDDDDEDARESMWYSGGGPGNPFALVPGELCPFPVGPGGVLSSFTSAGPVLSVDIATFSCPPQDGTAVTHATIKPSVTQATKTTAIQSTEITVIQSTETTVIQSTETTVIQSTETTVIQSTETTVIQATKTTATQATKTTNKLFSTLAVYTTPNSLAVPPMATPYTPCLPSLGVGGQVWQASLLECVCQLCWWSHWEY